MFTVKIAFVILVDVLNKVLSIHCYHFSLFKWTAAKTLSFKLFIKAVFSIVAKFLVSNTEVLSAFHKTSLVCIMQTMEMSNEVHCSVVLQ